MINETARMPLLDYFGGKWRMAARIIEHFPAHKSFVDPMCGAASIVFRKPRSKNEIINDIHHEIYNVFLSIREDEEKLAELLRKTPYCRHEYLKCREQSFDMFEQARRTIVKSWLGIGDSLDNKTGFRVSLSQSGAATGSFVKLPEMIGLYKNRLRGVIIENLDYKEIIRRYDKPDTLFYIDPPYCKTTRSTKHAYAYEWCSEDHAALVEILLGIKGMAVLSGYETKEYARLNWKKVEFSARSQKAKTTEILWIKN